MVVVVVAWRGVADLPPARRRALRALRVATALAALLVGVQPRWVGERSRAVPGRLAVLADGSASMGVRDAGGVRAERARALAERWASAGGAAERAVPFVFGAELRPGAWDALARAWPTDDADTRLGEAVATLLDDASDYGALLIVSDGRDLGAGAPVAALRRAGLAVHTVAVGEPVDDDAVTRVDGDPVAFLRTEGEVRVAIRARGDAGTRVPVTLQGEGGEVVGEAAVVLDEDGVGVGELAFVPERLGRAVYRVSLPLREGDTIPANNTRPFLVDVVREKLRVLHVVGAPSWDERFLRELLDEDPSIDLVSFFILRTTGDLTMAPSSDLALIPFPTEELFTEYLGTFDLVVFQNFDYRPYDMARHLPRIRAYVQRGGGFAMVGGELSFGSADYGQTEIAAILPVTLPPAGGSEASLVVSGDVRPIPTEEAVRHPIVELRHTPAESRAAWDALVPLPGANRFLGLRPGATTLLAHPDERAPGGGPLPILAVGEAGEGRVLALAVDASWKWGFTTAGTRGDASAYDRFWDRAIRWLVRDPSLEPARVGTDRERYAPRAPVRFDGIARDRRYRPLEGRTLRIAVLEGDGAEVSSATVTPDPDGLFEGAVAAPATPGAYRLALATGPGVEPLAAEPFLVEAVGDELARPSADPDALAALSEATGGVHHARAEDAPTLDAFDATRTESLGFTRSEPFASPWFVALALAGFLAEWALRRRWGLR